MSSWGIGSGRGGGAYKEPVESAHLRMHHESLKSGVALAKGGQTFGNQRVGPDLPTGVHRAIITKEGDAVTFAIDVDNDGRTDDDMELTVADIKAFEPALHSKNTHLFFGGGGAFKEVKLTFDPPPSQSTTSNPSTNSRQNADATPSDEFHKFGGRSPWPAFLEGSPNAVSKGGLFSSGDVRTKSGGYLNKDFTFEVIFPLRNGDPIVIIGIGESRNKASVFLRIHHEYLKSGVGLAKDGQTRGNQRVGGDLPTGTHRAIITKEGNQVTFAIDVDNDGPTDDDMELTVPDIKTFQPKLHSKNTHLFFGHGTFQEVRLSHDPKNSAEPTPSPATSDRGANTRATKNP